MSSFYLLWTYLTHTLFQVRQIKDAPDTGRISSPPDMRSILKSVTGYTARPVIRYPVGYSVGYPASIIQIHSKCRIGNSVSCLLSYLTINVHTEKKPKNHDRKIFTWKLRYK
jgi:hypothetical protein